MIRLFSMCLAFGLGCLLCVGLGSKLDENAHPSALASPPATPRPELSPAPSVASDGAAAPIPAPAPESRTSDLIESPAPWLDALALASGPDAAPTEPDAVESSASEAEDSTSLADMMDSAAEQAAETQQPEEMLLASLDPPPAETPDSIIPVDEIVAGPAAQVVHTNYQKAMKEASEDRKMLFIYFHDSQPTAVQRAFERNTLANVEIQEKLKRYVFVKLPRDAQIKVNGQPVVVLEHPAFAEMLGRQGVAVIDFTRPGSDYYGHVVSTFPFRPGRYYSKDQLSTVLDLPPGTLTQRTMIYAVRIHPEAPKSTQGHFHNVLAQEARQHADHQAAILLQGHHSWDTRFHRINAQLPGDVLAQEVVAESWPNETLVDACIECVDSWRQSPGHWGAVRSRHPLFGYDIKRGRNGIWYATGIFGRR
jgi:hypothetical protein